MTREVIDHVSHIISTHLKECFGDIDPEKEGRLIARKIDNYLIAKKVINVTKGKKDIIRKSTQNINPS